MLLVFALSMVPPPFLSHFTHTHTHTRHKKTNEKKASRAPTPTTSCSRARLVWGCVGVGDVLVWRGVLVRLVGVCLRLCFRPKARPFVFRTHTNTQQQPLLQIKEAHIFFNKQTHRRNQNSPSPNKKLTTQKNKKFKQNHQTRSWRCR